MCGIAGHSGPTPLSQERIDAALKLMEHRGPDHQAFKRFEHEGEYTELLHSRLSIIDLDPRSNQPMHRGHTWLVFNGELYNYLELGDSPSDTEVLCEWLDEGNSLSLCEGMWAIASYDERNGMPSLDRDLFGEKPLYVYADGDGLYFGSEVKFVTALLGRSLPLNHQHLYRYLVNGYKSLYKTTETFYQGVIEPRSRRPERPPVDDSMSYEEAVAGVRERLIRSVELRLRADVPLAFCMSGGVDSLALISIAKRVFDYDVHGFTIDSGDERYSERELVEYARDELGIRHTMVEPRGIDFIETMRTLVRQHDGPVSTITYLVHWLLMEAIAGEGYRIAISGTAADELFSGYYDHHLAYLAEYSDLESLIAWNDHVKPLVRNPHLQKASYFYDDPKRRDHIYLDADEFASYLKVPFDEPFTEEDYSDSLLVNRMENELWHEAVPVILHEDDLNAMSFSIENRSPYLDRELYEFARRIPPKFLIRNGYAKAVLRDAMRGIVPDRILDSRRKVGFNASMSEFLSPEVREWILEDSPIFDHVHREPVERILKQDPIPNSRSKFLFNFVNVKLFLEEFG